MFVARVDVVCFADVGDDGHAGVFDVERFELCFAEFGPAVAAGGVFGGFAEVSELDPVEGEVGIEEFAPAVDECFFLEVVGVSFVAVGFALVPDAAAHGVGDERVDHCVVDSRGSAGADFRFFIGGVFFDMFDVP